MSIEDRFRQVLTDTISEVKTRLEAEFDAALTGVKADAERDRAAALAGADEAMTRAKAEAEATVEAIRTELRDAQATAVRQGEESEATTARLQSEHQAATARLDAENTATAELRQALEVATRERDEQAAEVARLRDEFELAAVRMRSEFDVKAAESQQRSEGALVSLRTEAQAAATLYRHAVDSQQTGSQRVLEAVRALDGATSLTEVLDALTISASKEAGRAAMLVVKGDRVIGWRTIGFGPIDQEPRAIESSTNDVGAIASAVNTGRPAVTGTGSALAAPPFSDAPADRPGLAVPLLVAGRPVAVLYADPGSASPASGWTSPVEVLVRHASRCLEGLAVQRVTAPKAAVPRVAASA